jgi:ceramide glucosyltransferase
MLGAGASLLTSMVVGTGERSVGAAMENLQLSAFISPAMCTALHLAGINCVVGKSMLFRRSELEEAGGLELVRDILAEDFILGQTYQRMGKRVALSATTVENVNRDIPVTQFMARHSRWLKMRAVIHVGGFVADLLSNPTPLLAAAWVASGFDWRVGVALAVVAPAKIALDAFYMRLARGRSMHLGHLLLAPMKDGLMALIWIYACSSRSVVWRGRRLRLQRGSRLRPDEGALPVRLVRRVLGGASD